MRLSDIVHGLRTLPVFDRIFCRRANALHRIGGTYASTHTSKLRLYARALAVFDSLDTAHSSPQRRSTVFRWHRRRTYQRSPQVSVGEGTYLSPTNRCIPRAHVALDVLIF